jgi:hypothetical protein
MYIDQKMTISVTYDHRLRRIGHPVRSAIHKPQIGRLVVGWVTTSEYLLLYVFMFFLLLPMIVHLLVGLGRYMYRAIKYYVILVWLYINWKRYFFNY